MAKKKGKDSIKAPASPSWRAIRQQGSLRSSSAAARKRRMARTGRVLGIALIVLVLGGGLAYALYFSGQQFSRLNPAPRGSTVQQVDFASDGVLDGAWFARNFPLPSEVPTLDYDIFGLKNQLEAVGQIQRAEVEIALPSTLIVRVEEKQPVLRARVRDPQGEIRVVLIASDGTVYHGEQYPSDALRRLPGLTGTTFKWERGVIQPVPGMQRVAQLLDRARSLTPELYADWQWVSFERFDGDPEKPGSLISIKSRYIDRIVFAPHSFDPQLLKLNEVVMIAKEREARGIRKVDLSFADQAIVQYQ